jgi:hypothetical protein
MVKENLNSCQYPKTPKGILPNIKSPGIDSLDMRRESATLINSIDESAASKTSSGKNKVKLTFKEKMNKLKGVHLPHGYMGQPIYTFS